MDAIDEQIRRQQIDYAKEFLSIVFSMDAPAALDFYEHHIHDISRLLHDRFRENFWFLYEFPSTHQAINVYRSCFQYAIRSFDIRDAHSWFASQPEKIVRFIRDYYAQVGQSALSTNSDEARKTRERFPEMQDILEDLVVFHGQEGSSILLYSLLLHE